MRVDFVHGDSVGGGGGQKSRGRRTLMSVRAGVRVLEIRALLDWKKGTPSPPRTSTERDRPVVRYGVARVEIVVVAVVAGGV